MPILDQLTGATDCLNASVVAAAAAAAAAAAVAADPLMQQLTDSE